MDPLSAFSLACGVIQVVDFGLQTVSTARTLFKDGSTKNHEQLSDISTDFLDATSKLQQAISNAGTTTVLNADDQLLYDLAQIGNNTAEALRSELEGLAVTATGKRRLLQVTVKIVTGVFTAEKVRGL